MSYYTERHGLRMPIVKTYEITIDRYNLLFECCEQYFENIAWRYPDKCPDNMLCCGLDIEKLSNDMSYEIPALFKKNGVICKPEIRHNIFDTYDSCDEYDQYALLDFIEMIYANIKDIKDKKYHDFFKHHHFQYSQTGVNGRREFIKDINRVFSKTGLLYELSGNGQVNRIVENSVIDEELLKDIADIEETGLKQLLEEAIEYHKMPDPSRNKDAVEKLWDALERLKTFYGDDKKKSLEKILNYMSDGDDYYNVFDTEFGALTKIGNDFRIRHHEVSKIDITDMRYYDYFFNRCLSLIGVAIKYLKV